MRSLSQQTLKVEGHASLVRDVSSNAIISMNDAEFAAYQKRRETEKRNKAMIDEQIKQIDSLKCEMSEIKAMLSQLLKGK